MKVSMLFVLPASTLGFSMPSGSMNSRTGKAGEVIEHPLYPLDPKAMVRQAAQAVTNAMLDSKINRQVVRLPLSDSMYLSKEEYFVADRAIGWQGGPQETYRSLSPLTKELLQTCDSYNKNNTSGLTPQIQEQTLLDFDGSALMNSMSPMGALYDSLALLQPNTDRYYLKRIEELEAQFSDAPGKAKRLFLLVNPSWRDKDTRAWGFLDSRRAHERILNRYETTYALDQFIVRGNKLSLLKAHPYDWCVYFTPLSIPNDREAIRNAPKLLGTYTERPRYDELEALVKANII